MPYKSKREPETNDEPEIEKVIEDIESVLFIKKAFASIYAVDEVFSITPLAA